MKLIRTLTRTAALCFMMLCVHTHADASVVISGTRVIYNQSESEVTVKLTNNGKLPGLVKVWIDKGDAEQAPDNIDVPFTITPPLMRIDPTKSQTLRIMFAGTPPAADKETVFYLNVLEVPPKATNESGSPNQLQLAFRTRIKFFYRPTGLEGQPYDSPGKLVWHLKQGGGKNVLEASNPTQYNVSFDNIRYTDGSRTASFTEGGMIGPGETKDFPLKGDLPGAQATIAYTAINDYGGPQHGEAKLAP